MTMYSEPSRVCYRYCSSNGHKCVSNLVSDVKCRKISEKKKHHPFNFKTGNIHIIVSSQYYCNLKSYLVTQTSPL